MSCDLVLAELHQLARQQHASKHAAQHRVGAAPPMAAAAALGLAHAVQVMTGEDTGTAAHRLRWLTTAAGPGRLPACASGLDDWGRNTSDILRRVQLGSLGPNLRPGDPLRYRAGTPVPAVRLETTGALARARRHAIPSACSGRGGRRARPAGSRWAWRRSSCSWIRPPAPLSWPVLIWCGCSTGSRGCSRS
jgi:hypothetical protein